MKGTINFNNSKNVDDEYINFYPQNEDDYEFGINFDSNYDESAIKKKINKLFHNEYKLLLTDEVNKYLDMLDNGVCIKRVVFNDIDRPLVKEFLLKNKHFFNNKKIVINNNFNIEDSIYWMKEYSNIKDFNILNDNGDDVSKKSLELINDIAYKISDSVKKLNLSDYEKLIYIRDLINIEKAKYSHILNSSEFNHLFIFICKRVGLKCENYKLFGESKDIYERALVYLTDKKYDIDGIYFMDMNINDNKYLKTYNEFQKIDNDKYYVQDMKIDSDLTSIILNCINNKKTKPMIFYENLRYNYFDTINKLLAIDGIVPIEIFTTNQEKIEKTLPYVLKMIEKTKKEIKLKDELSAIIEVRNKELENDEDIDRIDKIVRTYYNDKINNYYSNKKNREYLLKYYENKNCI